MTFENLVKERYSVRKFDERPVEKEKLDRILEAGRLAPTGCNYQPQRIVVVRGADLEKMAPCTPMRFGQTAVLLVCWDRTESWKSRTGRDIGEMDGTIVLTQMLYRAWELGVGSLIVGMYKEDRLRETFRIPEHYGIVGLLLLGYPAQDCQPHPQLHFERKPLEKTVFYGSF